VTQFLGGILWRGVKIAVLIVACILLVRFAVALYFFEESFPLINVPAVPIAPAELSADQRHTRAEIVRQMRANVDGYDHQNAVLLATILEQNGHIPGRFIDALEAISEHTGVLEEVDRILTADTCQGTRELERLVDDPFRWRSIQAQLQLAADFGSGASRVDVSAIADCK